MPSFCDRKALTIELADRLLHQIYAAVTEPEGWSQVALDLASLVDGASVHMFLVSRSSGHAQVNLFVGGDPNFARVYLEDYALDDFRVPRVMARRAGRFSSERAYVSASEARVSRIHQELLPLFGVHDIHGSNLSFDDNVGWFGIATSRRDHTINVQSLQLLQKLSPHLLRGFKLSAARAALETSMSDAGIADLFAVAVLVMDGQRIVDMNRAAGQILDAGWFRLSPTGGLSCADPLENARLADFLRAEAGEGDSLTMYLRFEDTNSLYALRRWSPAKVPIGPPRTLLTITPLTITPPDPDQTAAFCAPFGITRAETRVVHAMLSSIPLSSFARSTGLSLYTAQDQLKSAMSKMGLPSQKLVFAAFERFRSLQV